MSHLEQLDMATFFTAADLWDVLKKIKIAGNKKNNIEHLKILCCYDNIEEEIPTMILLQSYTIEGD